VGFFPYSPSETFVHSDAQRADSPDPTTKVTIETPVDQRFVRRAVGLPTVSPEPAVVRRTDEIVQASLILASRISTYPILEGSTVDFGDTGDNTQAICYYNSARIVVNPGHTVSLEQIIDHEIWHIIDWRDNGRIDWGEDLPPANAAEYR
jgi:hypothetical protein